VGDPMCSWCWGMAPVIQHIADRGDVAVRVIVGGLRPGPNAVALDDGLRATLSHHWERVAEASGQPFEPFALERDDWVYDTELPAIAVVTMRSLAEKETLRFFAGLQRAFYVDGVDITDPEQYPGLIGDYPVDVATFMQDLRSAAARTRAWEDFAEARELGVMGFPTVLLAVDGSIQVLSRGYAGANYFDSALAHWVEGVQPTSADGACSIQSPC
nr:DsbA family protein [Acidimicrobiia bacterium]